MTLTNDQETALTRIVEWINNDTDTYLCSLIGPAGTGKTFLSELITKNSKYKFGVAVSAPTHKAKNVIRLVTGLEAVTVQALCGLAPNTLLDNFDINNPKFARRNEPQMGLYKLLLIDEASMINTELFEFIKELAYRFKTKILFIGDGYQVPPVGEAASPVFILSDYIFELRQPVRQKPDNPLVFLANAIRCDITTLTSGFNTDEYAKFTESAEHLVPGFNFLRVNNDRDDRGQLIREHLFRYICINHSMIYNQYGQGYEFTRDKKYFTDKVLSTFNAEQFKFDPNYARLCTFTNESVKEWNNIVRSAIIGTDEIITLNDLLMCYTTVSAGKGSEIVTNSQEYEVVKLEHNDKDAIKSWQVQLQNTGNQELTPWLNIVKPESYDNFALLHESMHYTARTQKGRAWVEYFKWRKNYLLLDSFNDYKTSPVAKYAKANNIVLKNLPKKDIDYGYVITTHKSQGSTYSNSFVDGKNIAIRLKVGDEELRIKKIQYFNLLYVALSRAKEKSIIYV